MGEIVRVEDVFNLNVEIRPLLARNFLEIIEDRDMFEIGEEEEEEAEEVEEGLNFPPPQTPPQVDRKRKFR